MGMSILFRNNGTENPFRDHFLELAEFPGDEFIMTTGYIQEHIFYDPSNPAPNGRPYIDTIAEAIENGLSNGGDVRVVAGRFWEHDKNKCNLKKQNHLHHKNQSCYMCNYNHFIEYLDNQTNFKSKNINVHSHHDSNWHAKIAVKLYKDQVVGLMIGSSNLTDAAFKKTHTYPNKECDVFIWNRRILKKFNVRCSIEMMSVDDMLSFEGLLSRIPVQITKKGLSESVIFDRILEVISPYRTQ
jgi:hypothetical protein